MQLVVTIPKKLIYLWFRIYVSYTKTIYMAQIIRTYYDNSNKLKEEYFENNGKKEGEYKSYWDTGNSHVICNYVDGKIEGEYKSYHRWNGQLDEIYNCVYGKKQGEYKKYHYNGNIAKIFTYVNGKKNGECKTYYNTGGLLRTYNFINGQMVGEHVAYDKNGKVKLKVLCIYTTPSSLGINKSNYY